jgi:hypothetical protein
MAKIGGWTLLMMASFVLSGCSNDNPSSDLFPDSGAPDATFDATIPPDAYEAAVDAAPSAVVPTADIDFGLSDCGGSAPGQQTFTIENAGKGDLSWSVALDSQAYFFFVGPTKGVIPGGGCDGAPCGTIVTLSANAIPANATAGLEQDSTVTVTTSDPAHVSTSIKVKVTPAGGTLVLQPSTVSFGLVTLNTTSSPKAITLRNAGNEDVTLSFVQPTDAEYQLTWDNAPATVTVPGNSSVPGLQATFTPNTTTLTSTSAVVSVTKGALCGSSLSAIPMTGQGSIGSVEVSTAVLDFGNVNCGGTAVPASQNVTLTNLGTSPFTWSAQLAAGASSPFTLPTSSGTVPAATDAGTSTGIVTVTALPIPPQASVAADAFGDTLEITTNIPGDTTHKVDLRETAQGVILAFSPGTIAFNNVPLANISAQSSFQVVNNGNAPVQGVTVALVAGDAGAGFFSLGTTNVGNVGAGASSPSDNVTFTPGNNTSAESATVTVTAQAGTVFCAAPLPTLGVSGTGTNGNIVLSTTSIPVGQTVDSTQNPPMGFGLCGSTPANVSFDISNTGNGSFTYNAVVPGNQYTLLNASNTVAVGGKQTVTVTVSQIGVVQDEAANGLGATVTVSTDIFGDPGGHQVGLRMTAQGALLAPSTSSIDFNTVPVGDAGSSNFTVTNTGNSNASVGFTLPAGLDGGASPFGISAGQQQIDGGNGSANYTATFTPTTPGPQSSQLIWNVTGTMCQTQPNPISVQGTGQ